MKPMNSKRLDNILDKLAEIGKRKVSKGNSLLTSMNINDDMIKIAAKHVVLDPIEKKLRTGYVRSLSKERPYSFKMATQFTELPPSKKEFEEEKKRKDNVKPSSAMGKYPSGSEQTTPYVGEQHGGDQVPAAITLSKDKGKVVIASSSLKEVIRELVQENQIFIDINQIMLRLNQKGQQGEVNIDKLCKQLADNGITLIKRASMCQECEDSVCLPKSHIKEDLKEFEQIGNSVEELKKDDKQILEKVSKEEIEPSLKPPKGWWNKMEKEVKEGNPSYDSETVSKTIGKIWSDFSVSKKEELREGEGKTYGKAPEKEARLEDENGFQVEAASIEQIRERLNSARDSRAYHVDMMQEKDIEDNQKEKHKKSKQKWEKEINRLDREYSKAVRVQRKEEREEAKKEKAEKAEQEQREMVQVGQREHKLIIDSLSDAQLRCSGCSWRFVRTGEIDEEEAKVEHEKHLKEERLFGGIKKKADSQYEQGDRVELVETSDIYSKLLPGTQGTVSATDDTGTVHVAWDDGNNLGMILDSGDKIKLVSETVEAIEEGTVVFAQEPIIEPSFELQEFLGPAEYQELQRLIDLRKKTWGDIADREERNIQEGLAPYANIDYSEVELYNEKIKQYQELAKSRKTQDVLPDAPEAEQQVPPMDIPEAPASEGLPIPDESAGVLDKKPMPEYASSKGKTMERKAELGKCPQCGVALEDVGSYKKDCPNGCLPVAMEEGEIEDHFSNPEGKSSSGSQHGVSKKAVTSQDFPYVCKNCKECVVPAGYARLTFLDHKVKPFCSISDGQKYIGFRYAYARECLGYNAILKEVKQNVETTTEIQFEEMKDNSVESILERKAGLRKKANEDKWEYPDETGEDTVINTFTDEDGSTQQNIYTLPANWREVVTQDNGKDGKPSIHDIMTEKTGNQHGMKKSAEYEDKPENEPATIDTKEEAEKRGKAICERCMQYFIPRGQKHMTKDWHSLWNISYSDVNHVPKGTCLPRSMSYMSIPDSGLNQFDTEQNRIVKDDNKKQ